MIKLTPLRSFYAEGFLFSCVLAHSRFDIDILRDRVPDLKSSSRLITVNIFNWLRGKKVFLENIPRKYLEAWDLVDLSRLLTLVHSFLRENS